MFRKISNKVLHVCNIKSPVIYLELFFKLIHGRLSVLVDKNKTLTTEYSNNITTHGECQFSLILNLFLAHLTLA